LPCLLFGNVVCLLFVIHGLAANAALNHFTQPSKGSAAHQLAVGQYRRGPFAGDTAKMLVPYA
jgi:hypothetical protein